MAISKVDWALLRRATPDPNANSTPPRILLALLNTAANCGLLLALPVVIPWTIVKHFVFGARAKWMDLRSHLMANIIRLFLMRFCFYLPAGDSGEWKIPAPHRWRGGRCSAAPTVTATPVRLAPATSPREGFADHPAVQAVARPGFMLAPKGLSATAAAGPDEKAILYLVGGGYAFGHPLERSFSWCMADSFGVRVLGVNYRKVLLAEDSFPAPLLDALAGWDYLTKDLGFRPENITFIGESAGAHLSLMLSRYLADIGAPGPGALALSGPWCDLSPNSIDRPSMSSNYGTDYIPLFGMLSARAAGRHYTREARDGPYFAPAKATRPEDWAYLKDTKVYVHGGEMELLIDEIRLTVKNMRAGGVSVDLVEEAGGIHVSPTMAEIFTSAGSWEVWKKDVGPIVNRVV